MRLGLGSLGISPAIVKNMICLNCSAQPNTIFFKKGLVERLFKLFGNQKNKSAWFDSGSNTIQKQP